MFMKRTLTTIQVTMTTKTTMITTTTAMTNTIISADICPNYHLGQEAVGVTAPD